jgi:hypothetical protein
MRHYSLILRKKSVLLDLGRVLLYYPLFAFLYEAIVFQPKPPFRARFFYCLLICQAFLCRLSSMLTTSKMLATTL